MAGSLPLLLYVTLFYMAIFSPVYGEILPKQKVMIQNSAEDHRDIWVHCFSGDDDLVSHLLQYSDVFERRFRSSIFGNTEFFCTVSWNKVHPKGTETHHTIAVFKQKFHDEKICKLPGCTYYLGVNSFNGPDGDNPWNYFSRRLIH